MTRRPLARSARLPGRFSLTHSHRTSAANAAAPAETAAFSARPPARHGRGPDNEPKEAEGQQQAGRFQQHAQPAADRRQERVDEACLQVQRDASEQNHPQCAR